MTSAELAQQLIPELEKALRAVVTGEKALDMFDCGTMTLPSGEKWTVGCLVVSEPVLKLIEPLLMAGFPAMGEAYRRGLGLPQPPPAAAVM